MSLRHALLGLLAQGPASGYDLTRAFDGGIGRYAWQAGHSRIYPELGKMTEAGQVVVDETGPRGRKSYVLTEDGRTELRRWMFHWPEQATVRDETVLRMFLRAVAGARRRAQAPRGHRRALRRRDRGAAAA